METEPNKVYLVNENGEYLAMTKVASHDDKGDIVSVDKAQAANTLKILKNALSSFNTNTDIEKKQPHIRIEFDGIEDIHVYVDGKEKAVSRLLIDWKTDKSFTTLKKYNLETIDVKTGRTIGEGQEKI